METPSNQNAALGVKRESSRGLTWLFVIAFGIFVAVQMSGSASVLDWPTDFEAAQLQAKEAGRPLLVEFSGPGCTYCRKMESEVLSREDVKDRLEAFELVRVDAWDKPYLARRFSINPIPAFIVLTPDGKVAGRTEGYQPADVFLQFLQAAQRAVDEPKQS